MYVCACELSHAHTPHRSVHGRVVDFEFCTALLVYMAFHGCVSESLHVHVHMHTRMHAHTHTRARAHTRTNTDTHAHSLTHAHAYTHVSLRVWLLVALPEQIRIHTYACTHRYMRMHTYIHYIHTHISSRQCPINHRRREVGATQLQRSIPVPFSHLLPFQTNQCPLLRLLMCVVLFMYE